MNILARRIQRFFRRARQQKLSLVNQRRRLFASTIQASLHRAPRTSRMMPVVHTQEDLLSQAKICLDNKRFEDQRKRSDDYLVKNDEVKEKQRCHVSKIRLRIDE